MENIAFSVQITDNFGVQVKMLKFTSMINYEMLFLSILCIVVSKSS